MKRPSRRAGVSLLEVVLATLLVGIVLVSSLSAVNGILKSRIVLSEDGTAEQLAQQLLAEIVEQPYEDPDGSFLFGVELLEGSFTRANFDDVDDYHLWNASPPEDRAGTALTNMQGWRRQVTVEWVDPRNPDTTILTNQGIKRITVTVSYGSNVKSKLMALRSDNDGGS